MCERSGASERSFSSLWLYLGKLGQVAAAPRLARLAFAHWLPALTVNPPPEALPVWSARTSGDPIFRVWFLLRQTKTFSLFFSFPHRLVGGLHIVCCDHVGRETPCSGRIRFVKSARGQTAKIRQQPQCECCYSEVCPKWRARAGCMSHTFL